MKKIIGIVGDWLQSTFPPNRVAILLAGTITAVSATIAAWVGAHFPGLHLGTAEVAGVLGGAIVITVRLLDRWFDRWQEGEPIHAGDDLESALQDLADSPDVKAFFEAHGTLGGIAHELEELRAKVEAGGLNNTEISNGIAAVNDVISQFFHEHPIDAG
jgi:hypothetical protein